MVMPLIKDLKERGNIPDNDGHAAEIWSYACNL